MIAKTLYVRSFGCQMNDYDSSRIADLLIDRYGLKRVASPQEADIVVMVTCSIREKAHEKTFSDLGRLREMKKLHPGMLIAVGGCVASLEGAGILTRAPWVDVVFGPQTLHRLPDLLEERLKTGKPQVDTSFPEIEKFDCLPKPCVQGATAFCSIMEGCSHFCSYCIVPYTRGAEISRPVMDVLVECAQLADQGVKEITLLGQNVNSYHGADGSGKERSLAYLLHKLAEIDGLKRIRYTTSYPADMTDELINCHRDIPQLMPYLHLPVQSGSDKILKAMNRRHNRAQYLDIIEKLYAANPALRMSSDFIVGFPGESDEDFEQTLDIVRRVGYIQAFSFKYSKRPGTPAALMPEQVEEKIKRQRLDILQELLSGMQLKFNSECLGKTMPVLFEYKGRRAGQLVGRTPYMQNIHVEIGKEFLNQIVDIKVTEAATSSLSGACTTLNNKAS